MIGKRLIEETFPLTEVGRQSYRERWVLQGHIKMLHVWWARRALAASRAVNYSSLVPAPASNSDLADQIKFVEDLAKWGNPPKLSLIEAARQQILEANGGQPPKVLDPFAGGGALPFEALRLGCETYACDLNPVAVLIEKCTLVYPQKYKHFTGKSQQRPQQWNTLQETKTRNPLVADVEKWSQWVLKEAKQDIDSFYPLEGEESTCIGYFWARSIVCQNPSCRASIPLMNQYWLATLPKRKIALYPYVEDNVARFKIVGTGYEPIPTDFDPSKGTISRSTPCCLVCGTPVDPNTIKRLFQEGKSTQEMIAVVTHSNEKGGRKYRIADATDVKFFKDACRKLEDRRQELYDAWGLDPVADEYINPADPSTELPGTRCIKYNMKRFCDLFNPRQTLALVTFTEKVRLAYELMLAQGYEEEYAKAISTYLAFGIDRLADYNSGLSTWVPRGETIAHTFTRQTIPMIWDYFELNPFSNATGDWNCAMDWISKCIEHCAEASDIPAEVSQCSATTLRYEKNYFDAIITDPPYYDNIFYSNLSDYFYVWLKRSIGHIYPDLFSTRLTPKSREIVADPSRHANREAAKKFFETMLKASFQRMYPLLKPGGIAVIVYAHKSTAGWETLINSLLDSGLVVTGAWPLNSERKTRLAAQETAALASSIYIVARKDERLPVGFYNEVRQDMKSHLNHKLDTLWKQGIGGADFFIAAIGSGIEVFGKYEKVIDFEGNVIRADALLDDVQHIATDYAVKQILHDGFGAEISNLTRFYVLWRWNYSAAKVHFDEAQKLAHSCDIDLSREWSKRGFIQKDNEFIRVIGPQARSIGQLSDSSELIDVLHHVLLLWEQSKQDNVILTLSEKGFGKTEVFYRVAQAIAETLPNESKEKKLLEGFLAGRERIKDQLKIGSGQIKLSDY